LRLAYGLWAGPDGLPRVEEEPGESRMRAAFKTPLPDFPFPPSVAERTSECLPKPCQYTNPDPAPQHPRAPENDEVTFIVNVLAAGSSAIGPVAVAAQHVTEAARRGGTPRRTAGLAGVRVLHRICGSTPRSGLASDFRVSPPPRVWVSSAAAGLIAPSCTPLRPGGPGAAGAARQETILAGARSGGRATRR